MAQPPDPGSRGQRSRNPNLRSSIYQGRDGYWHGRVTVGIRDDGTPDRRHFSGKSRSEIAAKVRALERARDQGAVRKTRETPSVNPLGGEGGRFSLGRLRAWRSGGQDLALSAGCR